jgi:hypothetical protein
MLGAFVLGPAGQPGEAFLLEDDADVGGAQPMAFVLQEPVDVIDGEVLLAGLDDAFADRIGFRGLLGMAVS